MDARMDWGNQRLMEPLPHFKTGWWFQIFFIFTLYLGKIPILTSIFFKWVGSTTNQKKTWDAFQKHHRRRLFGPETRGFASGFRLRKRAPGNGWYLKFVHHDPFQSLERFAKRNTAKLAKPSGCRRRRKEIWTLPFSKKQVESWTIELN